MSVLSRLVRPCAVLALTLYTSCSDGGSSSQRIYYSLTNYDGCVEVFAYLDLGSAHTTLARTDAGTPDCTLSPELVVAGCQVAYTESPNGDILGVKVDGCRVPRVSKLFSCEFLSSDLAELNEDANADCGCLTKPSSCYVNGICDMCASADPDSRDCEKCGNDEDDDGDGDVDCEDSDCELTETCGFGRTTITCSTLSTTTSTSSTSTSITIDLSPAAPMSELFGSRD